MKIGYPCVNRSVGCSSSRTFRLASYSDSRLVETVESNLDCLMRVLRYNAQKGLLFFRITSDLVPFASHPVCRFDWPGRFGETLSQIGRFIRSRGMRISMHPDPFTLLNSPSRRVLESSVRELAYHARVLDLLGLDATAKIQIHVGGVYGHKARSMRRFVRAFERLDRSVRRRLVIENDDRLYSLADCMSLHGDTGVPVLFDVFHHRLNGRDGSLERAFESFVPTWKRGHGPAMVDYSLQARGQRRGRHAESLSTAFFRRFLDRTADFDFDVMLEIKDKEKSALRALAAASSDPRLQTAAPPGPT
jgi:UV DNA damage endonuclease